MGLVVMGAEKRVSSWMGEEVVEACIRFDERGWEVLVVRMVIDDSIDNASREGVRVPAFSEKTEFCGTEGEGGINNEPVKISWE